MKYVVFILLFLPLFVNAHSFPAACNNCDNITVSRDVFDGGDHWRVVLKFPEFTGELHEPIPEEITYSNLTFINVAPRYENEELVWDLTKASNITYQIRPKMDKRVFRYFLTPRIVIKESTSKTLPVLLILISLISLLYLIGTFRIKKPIKRKTIKSKDTKKMIKRIREHIK